MALDLASLGSLFSPNFFRILGFALTIVSVLFAAAALGILFWYIWSYNVRIEYFDKRKNINKLKTTSAKRIVEDGITKLKIWMIKSPPLKLPDSEIVFSTKGRDKIFMTRDFSGHFNFVEWGDALDKDVLNELPPEARLWESLQYKKNLARFQKLSFWDKYGNLIIQYGFIVLVVFMLLLLFTRAQTVASILQATIESAKTCQQL